MKPETKTDMDTDTRKTERLARFDVTKARLDVLVRAAVPAIIKFDKAGPGYKRGVSEALFPESTHLQGKLEGYDSAVDFLAYYGHTEPAARLLSHLSGTTCTTDESAWFKSFMVLAYNNNIRDYLGGMPQSEDWLKLLARSKVDPFGSVANWGKFYAWLHKNAHPSWCRALCVRFLSYR